MGTYVAEADVRSLMPQYLGQVSTSAEYSNSSVLITKAIGRAEGIVNGYIAQKYSLPFTTVPPIILEESLALSTYYTYKYQYSADNMNRNEFVDQTNDTEDNVFANLKAIAKGDLRLTLTNGTLLEFKSDAVKVRSAHGSYQSIFDVDSATAWEPNSTLLDNIRNGRT